MGHLHSACKSKARLTGKTVVITGADSGAGKETALDLYWRGAKIVLACRNLDEGKAAIEEIQKSPPPKRGHDQYLGLPGQLVAYELDLCSFLSVRICAEKLINNESNIHILINNYSVFMCPYLKTEDGYEKHLQSNHLGHFLLTLLLLPKIKASGSDCRIINVSSDLHFKGDIYFDDLNFEKSYSSVKAYRQSKLANILFTKELARRLTESQIEEIRTYSLDPGILYSDLWKQCHFNRFPGSRLFINCVAKFIMKDARQSAQTIIHCAIDEAIGNETGMYYRECKIATPSRRVQYKTLAEKLWEESLRIVQKEGQEDLANFFKVKT